MDAKEAKRWLKQRHYPTTIISDRYNGTYSRGAWLAFPLRYDEIPEEVSGEDMECQLFWDNYKEPVGKGLDFDSALYDLEFQMEDIAKGK